MKPIIYVLNLIAFIALCPLKAISANHPEPGRIELAAREAINESAKRSAALGTKTLELSRQLVAFTSKLSGNTMTPEEKDQFALLTSQIRYLERVQLGEVYKRRAYEEIIDLVQVEAVQDEVYANSMASGIDNLSDVNRETDKQLEARLGVWATIWGPTIQTLKQAHQVHVAFTIPFEGLVQRLRETKGAVSTSSDDLELFFSEGDLSESKPFQIFQNRMGQEMLNSNKAAKEVYDFLETEWMKQRVVK